MHRFVALALLAGCNAYMSAGVDTSYRVHGGLEAPMKQTVMADARVAAAVKAGVVDAGSTEAAVGKTYTVQLGWNIKSFSIGLGIAAHDVDRSTFSFDSASSPHYAMGSGFLDVAWTPLRWKMFSTFLHAGPTVGAIVDRTSGTYDTGKGLRVGAGLAISLSFATVFLDVNQTELAFASGPAQGTSDITGATIGLAINR